MRSAKLITEFRSGIDKSAFVQDLKTQSAILHQLMVMGEAVKRLSKEFRGQHPEVPWTLIAGMRDKLIHGYDIVDIEEVWQTATEDVPSLLEMIQRLKTDRDESVAMSDENPEIQV